MTEKESRSAVLAIGSRCDPISLIVESRALAALGWPTVIFRDGVLDCGQAGVAVVGSVLDYRDGGCCGLLL